MGLNKSNLGSYPFPPVCDLARLSSSWAPLLGLLVLAYPSSQLLCSVGQFFSLSSEPAVQLASPCHLDLEDLFSVSSAFGHLSWLLGCSTLLQLLRSPCSTLPHLSFLFMHTDTLVLPLRTSMKIGLDCLTHSHTPKS